MDSNRDTFNLVNKTQGLVIASQVRHARGIWARAVGLIGRRSLDADEGLWISPCNGVHTVGMRFPVDVIALDRNMRVLSIIPRLNPFRVLWPRRGRHSVIELAAGKSSMIREGDVLNFAANDSQSLS
jgi:uncharacterized membrane protein (UPF0127 family)